MNNSHENELLAWSLNDRRNLTILILLFVTAFLAIAVLFGTYSVLHGPSPYELKSDADATYEELRTRMNFELATQQTVNTNVTNQLAGIGNHLDDMDDDINRLLRVEGLTPRKHKKR